jgi:hypothetical protein
MSRRLRLLLLVAALVGLAVVVVTARAPGEDPFAGVYRDPDGGRRVWITLSDGRYEVLFGAGQSWYEAERHGDELQVRDPFSGYVLVRATEEGLVLVSGGRETRLEPLADR